MTMFYVPNLMPLFVMIKDSWKIEDNVKINNILFWKLHFGEFALCWNALYDL